MGTTVCASIIYDDVATRVDAAKIEAQELFIPVADVQRATGFEVKPQGACRDALCFPLPEGDAQWFNLTAFARAVDQPVAYDERHATWYFGLRSDQRHGLASLQAPDFTLPDIHGKPHALSDLRGKKVFLVTWASW